MGISKSYGETVEVGPGQVGSGASVDSGVLDQNEDEPKVEG